MNELIQLINKYEENKERKSNPLLIKVAIEKVLKIHSKEEVKNIINNIYA